MQKKGLLNCSPAEVWLSVELFDGVRGLGDSLELDESASNHLAVRLLQDVDVDYIAALEKNATDMLDMHKAHVRPVSSSTLIQKSPCFESET